MNGRPRAPVTLKVEVDPEALKRLTEEGRLCDFVAAFPALAAGHIKGQIVEALAKGGRVDFSVAYVIEDDDFGTGPQPLPFIDTVPLPETAWGMRRIFRGMR